MTDRRRPLYCAMVHKLGQLGRLTIPWQSELPMVRGVRAAGRATVSRSTRRVAIDNGGSTPSVPASGMCAGEAMAGSGGSDVSEVRRSAGERSAGERSARSRPTDEDLLGSTKPRPRFAPPSRAPFDGFGNALTTAFEMALVTMGGYWLGSRIGGVIGGAIGLVLAATASFVRLFYRAARYESPLSRIKATEEPGAEGGPGGDYIRRETRREEAR